MRTRMSHEREGLLVDTGAVDNLTGLEFVVRQSKASKQHGIETSWEELEHPRRMAGVGKQTDICKHKATINGVLHNGNPISYSAPVIPGEPGESTVPPLYGLQSLAKDHTYVGSHNGILVMVPAGKDDEIRWPKGTEMIQCERSPSGHWLIDISHWDKIADRNKFKRTRTTHLHSNLYENKSKRNEE